MARGDAEIEQPDGQTGLHADHAKAAVVPRYAQRGQMRAVPGAEHQIGRGVARLFACVEELGKPALPRDIQLITAVLLLRGMQARLFQQSLRQTARLRKVTFFAVADNVDDHKMKKSVEKYPRAKARFVFPSL